MLLLLGRTGIKYRISWFNHHAKEFPDWHESKTDRTYLAITQLRYMIIEASKFIKYHQTTQYEIKKYLPIETQDSDKSCINNIFANITTIINLEKTMRYKKMRRIIVDIRNSFAHHNAVNGSQESMMGVEEATVNVLFAKLEQHKIKIKDIIMFCHRCSIYADIIDVCINYERTVESIEPDIKISWSAPTITNDMIARIESISRKELTVTQIQYISE